MVEIYRTNDPVLLSFLEATLRAHGIEPFMADLHMSMLDGNVMAIPRRLMVADEDEAPARRLVEAALAAEPPPDPDAP